MSDLLYHLNADDEITSVNEEWLAFAQANDEDACLPPQVLGRSLWEFIDDLETQHIYRQLHGRVRTRGKPVQVSFRCDAPERRRLLELRISAGAEQGLIYRVRTVRHQDRQPVPLLDPHLPRSERFVTMCGWCKRVAAPERGWLEVEDAVSALSLFAEPRPPQLTHGICDGCSRSLQQALTDDPVYPVLGRL
ncbi:hypothetical protein BH24GEM1_BH24GEM1_13150 [soil metagenome]|nr:hypothetical protein [Gemmatimonadales bacterium]